MSGRNHSKNSERKGHKATGPSSAPRPHRLEGVSPQTGILALQHNAGNQAVNELLESGANVMPRPDELEVGANTKSKAHFVHDSSRTQAHPKSQVKIQPKLPVSNPGDKCEQAADRVSEKVMQMPEPQIQSGQYPKSQKERPGIENEDLQMRRVPASDTGQTASPPIVHEGLRSTGQPLDQATRDFVESRFGHDFSDVRVHNDERAASQAEALSARAFTIGSDIHFGRSEYAPGTDAGRRLITHELAHVLQQQQSGPAVQRQPLGGLQLQTIPTELQSSADVGKMSEQELTDRHDRILEALGQFTMSTPDTALLEIEAARIGVELARRKALAAGRTFSEDSIKQMKEYFVKNSQKPAKPPKNPPPPPPGGWQDSCIVALNNAMKLGTSNPDLPTTHKTIEKTMEKIAASGYSGVAREVWFEGESGRITKGGARPEKLHSSIWDTVMSLAGGDPGWSVFTMSIDDGNHSVTLTLDANDPRAPHIYWSDQWQSKGGWKEYTHSELDAEVTRLVQGWWDKQKEGRKFKPVVRVWRVRATPATGGP